MITPDRAHRVPGTTYPRDVAPEGAVPLGDRLAALPSRLLTALTTAAVSRLRLTTGDVLVVRGDVPGPVRVGIIRALHKGTPNDPVAVFLPRDCSVHVERSKIEREDRGHRDTKNIDRDKAAVPPRGVFTGVQDGRDGPSDTTPR
jgi:hypothetical protein